MGLANYKHKLYTLLTNVSSFNSCEMKIFKLLSQCQFASQFNFNGLATILAHWAGALVLGWEPWYWGGSPGLVVMGGNLQSKSFQFESRHLVLEESFSHLFVVNLYFCLKIAKVKQKESGNSTILKEYWHI